MRFIQLTDLHIDHTENGVVSRQKFLDVVNDALRVPDVHAFIFTGDFCAEVGDLESYKWIKQQISDLIDVPMYHVTGNHDDNRLFQQIFEVPFDEETEEIYYNIQFGDQNIVFFDTSKGVCSAKQFEWASKQLQKTESGSAKNHILFMHHPPSDALAPFMDLNFPFKDSGKMLNSFKGIKKPVYIFCGHYHMDKVIHRGHVHIHITPAISKQLQSYRSDFGLDHEQPGYRVIDMDQLGNFVTETRYIRKNY